MKEMTKVSGIPANETFWQKAKRKAVTAGNWCKTHWKGIALGAIAVGGGAYMLTRHNDDSNSNTTSGNNSTGSGGIDYREAISQAFATGDGSDVGPEDDEPEEVDEY